MTAARRPRARVPLLIGATVLLAMLTVAVAVWVVRGGADRVAPYAQGLEASALRGAHDEAARVVGMRGLNGIELPPPAASRPAEPLAWVTTPSDALEDAAARAALLVPDGYLAGVPEALTAPLTLSGRVVDTFGTPLAGARILYLPDDATRDIARQATAVALTSAIAATTANSPTTASTASSAIAASSASPASAASPASPASAEAPRSFVLTGSDGRFVLRTARALVPLGRADGDVEWPRLLVDDPRCAAYSVACDPLAAGDVSLGTLVVSEGAVVSGRVVLPDGRPAAGVGVSIQASPWDRRAAGADGSFSMPRDLCTALTDALGEYSFRSLWAGTARVSIASPGWCAAWCDVPAWTAGASVQATELVAEPGGSVSGRVELAPGGPGGAVQVFALPGNWTTASETFIASSWDSARRGSRSATGTRASAWGSFRIDGLDSTAFLLVAGADGYRPAAQLQVWPGDSYASLRLEPDTQFLRGATIAVSVTDAAGAPLRGALLRATTTRPGMSRTETLPVNAGTPGVFSIAGVGPQPVHVVVMARGFATTRATLPGSTSRADSAPHRLALPPESRVDGRVLDAAGAPVPGATVMALGPSPTHAETDESGRFTLHGLGAGSWDLRAVASGVCRSEPVELELAAAEPREDVLLSVQRPGALQGRVHHRDGTAARPSASWFSTSASSVRIVGTGAGPDEDSRVMPESDETRRVSKKPREDRRVTPEPDGSFRAEGLLPGSYELSTDTDMSWQAEVRSGETTLIDLVVPRNPVVTGRVLAGDAPVQGARVTSESLAMREFHARGGFACYGIDPEVVVTDAQGRFELELLSLEKTAVWATSPGGGRSGEVVVTVAEDERTDVELRLGAGRIEGDLVDALTQRPVADAMVYGGNGSVRADAAGHFALENVQPGQHRLLARARGYLPQHLQPITLDVDGQLAGLRVALAPAAGLEVTVLAPDGRPVSGQYSVVIWRMGDPRSGSRSTSAWTGSRGLVSLTDLEPGIWRIGARDSGSAMGASGKATLEEQMPQWIEVSLGAGESRAVSLGSSTKH